MAEGAAAPASERFLRDQAGRVALAIAAQAEGRAHGLSVEIWPDRGVWLRTRDGHELRIFVDADGENARALWERRPGASSTLPTVVDLGPVEGVAGDSIQRVVMRWLSSLRRA